MMIKNCTVVLCILSVMFSLAQNSYAISKCINNEGKTAFTDGICPPGYELKSKQKLFINQALPVESNKQEVVHEVKKGRGEGLVISIGESIKSRGGGSLAKYMRAKRERKDKIRKEYLDAGLIYPGDVPNEKKNPYKYKGNFGTEYKYDLSNPAERQQYENDMAAQVRDNANPQVILDRQMGIYGGGAKQ